MPDFKDIAVKRLQNAQKELSGLDERRTILLGIVKEYQELLAESNGVAERPARVRLQPYSGMTAIQTMKAILRSEGRPMRVADIAKAAADGGYRGASGDATKIVPNFSSTLSRLQRQGNSPFAKGEMPFTFVLAETTSGSPQEEK